MRVVRANACSRSNSRVANSRVVKIVKFANSHKVMYNYRVMRVFSRFKTCIFLFAIFIAVSFCFAESFRTRKTVVVTIPEESVDETSVSVGINDSIAVFLPSDRTFIYGIEMSLKIPSSIYEWRDSVACALYDSIYPLPTASRIDYDGKRIFLIPLPAKAKWIVQIPLSEDNLIKENSYITKASPIPSTKDGFVFVRFLPVMKGVPSETMNANLSVSVKPLVFDKGRLFVKIFAESKRFSNAHVFIDDKPEELKNDSLILDAGMHSVNIQSDEYRNEVRSVFIEAAKNTECVVELKSLEPLVFISAPKNFEVYLDDVPLENFDSEFSVSVGEHTFRFVIGGYEIIRNLSCEKGKTYNMNISLDLQITEESK